MVLNTQDRTGVACLDLFAGAILCDNGVEFDRFIELESLFAGVRVFYTRAYASGDKGSCERNHVLVRYMKAKGESWGGLDQTGVSDMFSAIDSYPRRSIGWRTPFEVVEEEYGEEFLECVGITKKKPEEIVLRPKGEK